MSCAGFLEKRIHHVVVDEGRDVNLGSIQLRFVGCDAPGIICDFIGSPPEQPKLLASGRLEAPVGCAIDFEKGNVECGADPSKSDTLLLSEGDRIYLEARNGALLAEPDSGDAGRFLSNS